MLSVYRIVLVFALIGIFVSTPQARGEEVIRISLSTSLRESLFKGLKENFFKQSGIKIDYLDNEKYRDQYPSLTIVSFKDVIEDKADAAVASTVFDEWVKLAKKYKLEVPADITHRVVGRDLMSIVVNKATGIKELTDAQLKAIYSGAAINWKTFGGADIPIVVLHSSDKVALRATMSKAILGGSDFGPNQTELKRVSDVREKVATMPGAIAYDSTPETSPNVIVVKTPPLGRPATLITKARPTPNVEKLISFIRSTISQ
jgi:ABC-type phosphate transport system substrate-binding protein